MPRVGHPWRKHFCDAWFIVIEVDTSMMIILVMSWNTSTIAQVWLSWFCHKFVMDVHAWQKNDLLWQTRIITEVYFLVLLLSLWISIQSSPRFSWRSIRCNSFCGVFVEIRWIVGLWSDYLWILFEHSLNSFMHDLYSFVFLSDLLVWFGQLDWFFLQWERCFVMGSILRCPHPVTK